MRCFPPIYAEKALIGKKNITLYENVVKMVVGNNLMFRSMRKSLTLNKSLDQPVTPFCAISTRFFWTGK
jgi:hypothetical protein